MDTQVTAVLDEYHDLIAAERAEMRKPEADRNLDKRFLAVGPQTGQLLNVLARSFDAPVILELGTSMGYSGIWLAEAAKATGGRLITMEAQADKSAFAREMSEKAGLADHVEFLVGDAVQMIGELPDEIDVVLLDLWKDLYLPCYQAFLPKLNPGAVIVADNITPGRVGIDAYVEAVRGTPDMDSFPLEVGSGIEISRYKAAEVYEARRKPA